MVLGKVYDNFSIISEGVKSLIFKANKIDTPKLVAIKVLALDPQTDIHELNDIKVSIQCNHQNIIKIQKLYRFGQFLFCVMDYFPYTLKNYPHKKKFRKILLNIIDAITYLHSKSVIHNNINLDNILISNNDEVKLIDFHMSHFIQENKHDNMDVFAIHECFTIFEDLRNQMFLKDIFSIGTLIFEFITDKSFLYEEICFKKQIYPNYDSISTNMRRNQFIEKNIESEEISNIIKMCCKNNLKAKITLSHLKAMIKKCKF